MVNENVNNISTIDHYGFTINIQTLIDDSKVVNLVPHILKFPNDVVYPQENSVIDYIVNQVNFQSTIKNIAGINITINDLPNGWVRFIGNLARFVDHIILDNKTLAVFASIVDVENYDLYKFVSYNCDKNGNIITFYSYD